MKEKSTDELMVVDTLLEKHLIGTINDRDITEMSIRQNVDPLELNAEQCIRPTPVSIRETATISECQRLMSLRNMKKITVVDDEGHLCGIVGQENLSMVRSEGDVQT